MTIQIIIFIAGLIALVIGALVLVSGAARLAARLGISPLVIGLTVVAFGTSAPETAVTVSAALGGNSDVAIGNVVGSNIFNILLILGLCSAIAPLTVHRQLIRQEVPIMIGVSLLLLGLIFDGLLSQTDAMLLFSLLIAYTVFLVIQARRGANRGQDSGDQTDEAGSTLIDRIPAGLAVIAGLILLTGGGQALVSSAVFIARTFGISELVIGLTVVSIGTSLPEVATAVSAVMRGQRDLAIGNVVGSNLFNILCCLGIAGMIAPDGLPAPAALLNFDIWVMVAAAGACLPIIISGHQVSRWEGYLLLGFCVAYLAYTLLAATHHDALPAFSYVMMVFVFPLAALMILASLFKSTKPSRPTP